jgi:hypothetical protein
LSGIGTTSPASVGNAGRKVLKEDTSGIGAELILNSINAKFRVLIMQLLDLTGHSKRDVFYFYRWWWEQDLYLSLILAT